MCSLFSFFFFFFFFVVVVFIYFLNWLEFLSFIFWHFIYYFYFILFYFILLFFAKLVLYLSQSLLFFSFAFGQSYQLPPFAGGSGVGGFYFLNPLPKSNGEQASFKDYYTEFNPHWVSRFLLPGDILSLVNSMNFTGVVIIITKVMIIITHLIIIIINLIIVIFTFVIIIFSIIIMVELTLIKLYRQYRFLWLSLAIQTKLMKQTIDWLSGWLVIMTWHPYPVRLFQRLGNQVHYSFIFTFFV